MSAELLLRQLDYALPEALEDLDAGLEVAREVLRSVRVIWEQAEGDRADVLQQVWRVFGLDTACYLAQILGLEQWGDGERYVNVEDCPLHARILALCFKHHLPLGAGDEGMRFMGCVLRVLAELFEASGGSAYQLVTAVEDALGAEAALNLAVILLPPCGSDWP